eukprot:3356336-Pleurochrysis_carterae.AAC.2
MDTMPMSADVRVDIFKDQQASITALEDAVTVMKKMRAIIESKNACNASNDKQQFTACMAAELRKLQAEVASPKSGGGFESTREYTRRPIRDPVARRDSHPSPLSRPTQFGLRPGRGATAAPVAAIHAEMGVRVTVPSEMGVRVTVPSRTESSIPVPMATNPVTRRLAFNSMSPHSIGAMRPVEPDGQVALHYTHLVVFAQRMHQTILLRMIMCGWLRSRRTGAEISGRHCLRKAGEPDLSTMTHLRESIRTNLLQSMESDVSSLDVHQVSHQPANAHRKARTHYVLIADSGSRSYPDHTNPAHLAAADVPAARVDRLLSRIPRYAGAGSRRGRGYFHCNPVNTFVSAIEVQLAAMQRDRSDAACD